MEKSKRNILWIAVASVLCIAIVVCSIVIPIVSCKKTKCIHEFAPATCTSPERCIKCNATRGDKLDHGFRVTLQESAATCYADGFTLKECPFCHEQRSERIAQLSHDYQVDASAGATLTCETDAVTAYKCSHCGDAYAEITTRHTGHVIDEEHATFVSETAGEAPCTHVITTKAACKTCTTEISRQTIVTCHETVSVEEEPATCVQAGSRTYTCECGEDTVVELPIAPNAHNWGEPDALTGVQTCRNAGCNATRKVVTKTADEPIIAADLTGENVAIQLTGTPVTFAPDTTLAGKMDGAKLSATTDTKSVTGIEGLTEVEGYDLGLQKDDTAVDFDGGKMQVSLPLPEISDPEASLEEMRVLYIDDTGKPTDMDAVLSGSELVFEAEHFSFYTVVRLTRAQLCGAIGHNYDTSVVAPTCTNDGMTVKRCRRCGDRTIGDYKTKLGHDMKTTVVAPTCVERGYTVNICDHGCGETYINDYKPTVAHNYVESVVAPTCTKSGYTLHVCSVCKAQYRDNYVDATGHSFSGGKCTVCGEETTVTTEEQNFYTNLIKSLFSADGYYLATDGIKVVIDGDTNEIENYRFSISVDENGSLVGRGEGRALINENYDGMVRTGVSEMVVVMQNGNIYMYTDMTMKNNGISSRDTSYSFTSQSAMLPSVGGGHADATPEKPNTDLKQAGRSGMQDTVGALLESEAFKSAIGIVEKLFDSTLKDSPTEAFAKKAFEYLFDKQDTENGVELTLNFAKVKTLIETCRTQPANVVFDKLFGDGSYAKLATLLNGLPGKKIAEITPDIASLLGKYGLTLDDLCNIADGVLQQIMPGIEIGIADIYKNYNGTVAELITSKGGDGEGFTEMWNEMYTTVNAMLTDPETSAVDAIAAIMGGGEASIPDAMWTEIDSLIDAVGKSMTVKLITDKTGHVDTIRITADECSITVDGEELSLDGTVEISTSARDIPGGKFDRTVDTVTLEKNRSVPTSKQVTLKQNGVQKVFMPVTVDGKTLMAYGYALENIRYEFVGEKEEAVYNGADCFKRVARSSYNYDRMTVYDPTNIGEISIGSSCGGYKNISFEGEGYPLYYYVYIGSNNKVLGWEFAPQETEPSSNYGNYVSYYYNAVTGKYTANDPHNYVKIDGKAPESCAKPGYATMRCSICGRTYSYSVTLSHTYQDTRAFVNANATSCTEGVRVTRTCKVCGDSYSYTYKSHDTYRQVVAESECGTQIYKYTCLCGERDEKTYQIGRDGGCSFENITERCDTKNGPCEHGYAEHRKTTYTCSRCNFKYVEEQTTKIEGCKRTSHTDYIVGANRYVAKDYVTYQHTAKDPVVTENGNVTTEKVECAVCGERVYEARTQMFTSGDLTATRPLYRFDCNYGGTEYVYDGCEATVYYLDQKGVRTGESYRTDGHADATISETPATCTRHGTSHVKCLVCDREEPQVISPRRHELDWEYLDQTGVYRCRVCDTVFGEKYWNYHWYEWFGFDDLTEPGKFEIGYYMWGRTVAEHLEFMVDYSIDPDTGAVTGKVVDVDFDQNSIVNNGWYNWGYDGTITVDTEDLKAALEKYSDYETFGVIVTIRLWGDKYDGDYIQYALNFTRAEMESILNPAA